MLLNLPSADLIRPARNGDSLPFMGTKSISEVDRLERDREADFITLPDGVKGTNCFNCRFVDNGHCNHPKIDHEVTDRNCCALWDAEGVGREWEENPTAVQTKALKVHKDKNNRQFCTDGGKRVPCPPKAKAPSGRKRPPQPPAQPAQQPTAVPEPPQANAPAAPKKVVRKATGPKAPPPQKPASAKVERAKKAHKMVDKNIQRYAEEYNEPRFARVVGGQSFPDSEPVDVAVGPEDKPSAGFELKTMVDNGNDKITMDRYAQVRKVVWERDRGATFHTVVSDDRQVYNAKGEGQHDDSKRKYYYRRGIAGSARIGSLYECKDEAELKRLLSLPEDQLPEGAKRTDQDIRQGQWRFFRKTKKVKLKSGKVKEVVIDKGYENTATGEKVRPKK